MCNCNNSIVTTCTQSCGCNNPIVNCDCPVKLVSDCVTFNGDTLAVSGIESGQDLTATLTQLDAYIGEAVTQISNSFSLVNIGLGIGIYAGIDSLGRKKLKSITTSGNLISLTNNTNDIDVSIDENELITFIQDNNNIAVGILEFTDNAAAILGGLQINAIYRTGDLLKIVH